MSDPNTAPVDPGKAAEDAALAAVAREEERLGKVGQGVEAPAEQTGEGEGDKLLAGKYKTPEELEAAYKELEKKLGQSKEEPKTEAKEGADPSTEEAKETVQGLGLDWDKLNSEFADGGKLSDETYADLEAKGLPRHVVDAYIEGQSVRAEKSATALYEVAGGKERLTAAMEWAAKGLEADAVESFNKTMEGTDTAAQKLAISGLMASYERAARTEGFNPVTPNGDKPGNPSGPTGLVKTNSMQEAMADPRYSPGRNHDPFYVAEVERLIAAGRLQ